MSRRSRGKGGAAWLLALGLALAACAEAAPQMAPDDLLRALAADDPPLVLDVRTPGEYAQGHVAGAVNLPHTELASRLAELEGARDRTLVVYCESGRRSGIVLERLRGAGFEGAVQLQGDMRAWRAQGRPLVRGAGD